MDVRLPFGFAPECGPGSLEEGILDVFGAFGRPSRYRSVAAVGSCVGTWSSKGMASTRKEAFQASHLPRLRNEATVHVFMTPGSLSPCLGPRPLFGSLEDRGSFNLLLHIGRFSRQQLTKSCKYGAAVRSLIEIASGTPPSCPTSMSSPSM